MGDVIRELIFRIILAHLRLYRRRTRSNLREAVHHRFGRPTIRPVYSINRIRNKHPLVAECVSVNGTQLQQILCLHLELFCL